MDTVLFAIWFFLPAGIGNTLPIIAAHLPYLNKLNYPMDFGKKFHGKRILGPHKTWRGLAAGIIGAIVVVYLQQQITNNNSFGFLDTSSSEYLNEPAILLGFLFGLGALGGDAIKSFVKRQIGIPAGNTWFPFDQLDYILGACILMLPVVVLTPIEYLSILIVWFASHLFFSYIGYKLGLKSRPV